MPAMDNYRYRSLFDQKPVRLAPRFQLPVSFVPAPDDPPIVQSTAKAFCAETNVKGLGKK